MSAELQKLSVPLGLGILAVAIYLVTGRSEVEKNPPGPPPRPILGNALSWPANEPWKVFFEWSKQYGDLVYTTVFTRRLIVINSINAVDDLLNKRANVYSHRPYLYLYEVANRMLVVFNITTEHERFRTYRKLLQGELGPRAVDNYAPLLRSQTVLMLQRIAKNPDDFHGFIRQNTGSTVLRLTYGYDTLERDDPFIIQSDRALGANTQAAAIWLADYYPILRKVPTWLAPWKRKGIEIGREIESFGDVPANWFKERLAANNYKDCFLSRQWVVPEGTVLDDEAEDIAKQVAIGIYAGGVDTVSSTITTFVLLMALYPDVQEKARAELDACVGRNRLPNETDFGRPDMPYITAMIKETHRWAPAAPLGLPHCANVDDEYRGFHIRKGTFMIPNIWGMMHDAEVYPEPFTFKPERHIGPDAQPDPTPYVFGFGKRLCPGIHFGQLQLFLSVCSILSVFKISKAMDSKGEEIEPEITWRTSTVTRVDPFACRFQLRENGEHLLDESITAQ